MSDTVGFRTVELIGLNHLSTVESEASVPLFGFEITRRRRTYAPRKSPYTL